MITAEQARWHLKNRLDKVLVGIEKKVLTEIESGGTDITVTVDGSFAEEAVVELKRLGYDACVDVEDLNGATEIYLSWLAPSV